MRHRIEFFGRADRTDGPAGLAGHGLGILGAHLVFGGVYLWGFPLVVLAAGKGWAITCLADAAVQPLGAWIAVLVGADPFAATVAVDALLWAASLAAGLLLLARAARLVARDE